MLKALKYPLQGKDVFIIWIVFILDLAYCKSHCEIKILKINHIF